MELRIRDFPVAHGYCYVSPIDGVYVHIDANVYSQNAIIFAELEKAGKLIRELREEIDVLKGKAS